MMDGQPPLLARPSHGLLARHGWVLLAAPGGALLLAGLIGSGFLGSSSNADYAASVLIGLALLIALALLVIGLPGEPIRVLVDPHRPRDAIAATNHGYGSLAQGVVGTLCFVFSLVALVDVVRRSRRSRGGQRSAALKPG